MKHLILGAIFYAIACPLILSIDRLSPTDMAGPGWDIVVYFLSAVITIVFLVISLIKINSHVKLSYLNLLLNAVGSLAIIFVLYLALTTRR
jgi:hypothetical protein